MEPVLKIAQEAGRRILEVYRSDDWDLSLKKDQSPVTRADLLSHHYILAALQDQYPYPVLSEEDPVEFSNRTKWDTFWLVDPLDGTRDFLHRNDEFTVNIALVRDGVPVAGIIHNPALKETYFAEAGKGAYVQRDGGKATGLPVHTPSEPVGTLSRFHSGEKVASFFKTHNVQKTIPCGSAIKFCRLAEGTVTLYPRFSGSMEWDIAAGQVLVEESGGSLLSMETGMPPVYNKESLFSPHFVAFRAPHKKEMFFPKG